MLKFILRGNQYRRNYKAKAKAKDKFGTQRMIIISIIVLATVITIVNYDRKTFIVQATGDS